MKLNQLVHKAAISGAMLTCAASCILTMAALTSSARAGSLYWNSAYSGGTWADVGGGTGWNTSGTGATYNQAWGYGGNYDANFTGTPGTVAVSGTISSVNSITFRTDGYTLSGGTINLTGTGGDVTTGSGSDSISSNLTGSVGLTKLGSGTLALGGANSYTGPTAVSGGGTLSVSNIVVANGASNLGNATSAVTLGGNTTTGTLLYTGNSATYTRGFNMGAGGGVIDVATAGQTLTIATNGIGYYSNGDVDGSLTIGGAGNTTVTSAIGIGNGMLYVGNSGNGTLNLTNGGSVSCQNGFIGYNSGGTGALTVSGTGSTWNTSGGELEIGSQGGAGTLNVTSGASVSSYSIYAGGIGSNSTGVITVDGAGSSIAGSRLCVGTSGNGTLNISHGASVTMTDRTYVAANNGSTGMINFGAGGGTLTTNTLIASPNQFSGTGTINANGLVSDLNLVFNSPQSLKQTITLASGPNQNISVNLDMSNTANVGWLGAGCQASGSLTIENGAVVQSTDGLLGDLTGSNGVATVTGNGSMWKFNGYLLWVGYWGNGVLTVTNGGTLSGGTAIGFCPGSTGLMTVNGAGSTWTTSDDADIGDSGKGTLNITNGGTVVTQAPNISDLGYETGSSGTVNVSGTGSSWTTGDNLLIGCSGSGTLRISNGGTVISQTGYGRSADIGAWSGSTGIVTVDGAGSTLTIANSLVVGGSGSGTCSVTGGGAVTASSLSVNSTSLLAIDVGRGSSLNIGSGSGILTNNGTIRILAGADVTAGNTYSPISAAGWTGTGTYQAVGGTWNASTDQFTASAVQAGASGTPVSINLLSEQRVLVTDGPTDMSVGASFLAKTTSTPLNFTATPMGSATLSSLDSLLGANQSILAGWNFSADSGYTPGDPVYLSLGIGPGYCSDDLEVWHYSGSAWTELNANDLTYDGAYASFTVTGFSGYAVTATVPEPTGLAMLVGGALFGLLACARRQRRA